MRVPEWCLDMRVASLLIALAFTSCGGEPDPSRPEPPATEAQPSARSESEATDRLAAPATAESAGPPSAAPILAFVATPGVDGVSLSIANHGTSDVSLRASVAVEIESAGSFAAAPSTSTLTLRYDCAHEADRCVTLAPGAELVPPSWLGTWGDMQCECTRCGPVEAGNYRLVVSTCDGAHRVESNAFAMTGR
jgi:hypothetical protein